MQQPLRNQFREVLLAGQTQLGLWLAAANPYTAELAAASGFDWLLIDGEHAPNDVPTILAQLQAVAPYNCHPIVRPVSGDPALIKQFLDIGAQTLLVPMVETAQQARDLVAAMHYPPRGIRGVAGTLARASRWGRIDDYLRQAGDTVCLLVQVETRRGVDNLDEIVRVEGVDGVFVGPADLSASMGHLGNAGHPDVQAAVEGAISTIRGLGKAAGVLATDETFARRYMDCGATFVAVAVDTMLFAHAIDNAIGVFRGKAAKPQAGGSY
jgi:4-hydroxy-2-oxoheptanedioate aldolase